MMAVAGWQRFGKIMALLMRVKERVWRREFAIGNNLDARKASHYLVFLPWMKGKGQEGFSFSRSQPFLTSELLKTALPADVTIKCYMVITMLIFLWDYGKLFPDRYISLIRNPNIYFSKQ